jgi:hypothetical protein
VISVAILHASEQTDAGSGALNGRCGITLRAVLLSVLLILVFNVLVSRVELVTGRYIASGIPPIPAVATLAALVALYPLGRLILGRYNLRRQELLVIYCLMTIAIPLCGTYGLRSILPRLTVMQYYATAENRFADYSHLMPSWYAPDGEQAITSMYEGLDGGAIPWSEWRKPLVLWSLFFLALFVGTMSLMSVMSRQWAEGEHLPYPLVQLPIEMVEATDARGTLANFFTNPLTWIGITLALIYNGLNIANAVNPAVPAIPQSKSLSEFFTERPWSALNPLTISSTPQYYGFGFLVSRELCFSIFVCTMLAKLAAVFGAAVGVEPPGWPYMQEQSAGGYLLMAGLVLWVGRGHLRQVAAKALGNAPEVDDSAEPIPYRWALVGMAVSAVFFLIWTSLSGMSLKIALPFYLIVMSYGLTYARVRAEMGVPDNFIYPYRLPQYTILYAIGSRGVLQAGGPQTNVIFEVLSFLSRFHPVQIMTSSQADAYQMARSGNLNSRKLSFLLLLAFGVGLLFAFWGHFSAFYTIGLNVLEGNPRNADWRTVDTVAAYGTMVSQIETPTGPDWQRTGAIIVGAGITLGLAIARMVWLRFPIHPLGYIVALSYGPSTSLWFPFLVVWLVKGAIERIGGLRLFRRLIPLFIGYVVAHYVFGGIVWSIISLYIESAVSARYYTVF